MHSINHRVRSLDVNDPCRVRSSTSSLFIKSGPLQFHDIGKSETNLKIT